MPSCEVLVSDAMYKVYWSDGEYIQGFRSDHLDPNVNLFGTPRKLIGACRPKCSMEEQVFLPYHSHTHTSSCLFPACASINISTDRSFTIVKDGRRSTRARHPLARTSQLHLNRPLPRPLPDLTIHVHPLAEYAAQIPQLPSGRGAGCGGEEKDLMRRCEEFGYQAILVRRFR